MRKIISFAIAGVMAFVVASCGGSSDLGVIAQLENKKCPVKIPGIGSITSVEYSGDTLRFNCSVSNRALNLASMAEHPEAMKQAVMPLLPDLLKNDDLGNKLLENKAYLSLHYYSKGPKRPKGLSKSVKFPSAADIDVVITPDEIKDIMEGKIADSPKDKLAAQIAMANAQCPMKVDSETTLESVAVEGNSLIYVYSIDESGSNSDIIDVINENSDNTRNDIVSSIKTSPEFKPIIKACNDAGLNIIYRYKGATSGKTCDITIDPSDL